MRPQNLSIQSDVFDDLRDRFDKVLTLTLRRMDDRAITDGTVTIKVAITLVEGTDENTGEPVLMPEFSGTVEMNLPIKGKAEIPKKAGYIMTRDPCGEGFIIASGQQYTFMDLLEEQEHAKQA